MIQARELDRDGARALRNRAQEAVLHVERAGRGGVAERRVLGLVEVLAREDHVRPQRTHALDLERVRVDSRENGQLHATLARRKRHALAEVARRGTNET